ncbi:MAG: hypothetical protein KBS80_04950 [Bacteroidales bacterium]|nr:hypothetical protein [Candidatus Cryptobacteroides choladohippi]
MNDNNYKWEYSRIGGVTRVNLRSGEDIAHLGELDQKLWTVLSCPTKGLEFDARTLELLDTDGDGKIRVPEIVAAAQWLTSVVKDKDLILKGETVFPLAQFNTENEEGAKLLDSARQILANLGLEKDEIALEDTLDSCKIFEKSAFNGDGIITAASTGDEELGKLIGIIIEKAGKAADRSGADGVTADNINKFYDDLAAYSAWQAAAESNEAVHPYGADTAAALAACEAVKDKVADYFMRCKLIAFNADAASVVDIDLAKIGAVSDQNLAGQAEEISKAPIARPCASGILPFAGINPAWKAAFDAVKALVLDKDFAGKDGITEEEWNATLAKFGPYTEWAAAKAGADVESLSLEEIRAILSADRKAELLALVDADKALEAEANGIDAVGKFMLLMRDFFKLLNNYVTFSQFYNRDPENRAIFEAGKLYIDQRCCDLCIRVENMGAHAGMAGLSGMFLIYCTCTSKAKAEKMNIVAVMTDGPVNNLRPGLNGVFYDCEGNDWDAVVTSIVDNPISVKQAFWGPYRKFANMISDKITKKAEEKDASGNALLAAKAEDGAAKQPMDPLKYASTFAIVGVAIGTVAGGLAAVVAAVKGLVWWKWFVIIAAILLVISGPACFIAWRKLRKRNLGPVLNANGWAVNSSVLVNILFGGTLTTVAKYPKVKMTDPFKKECHAGRWILGILIALIAAAAVLFLTGTISCPFCK